MNQIEIILNVDDAEALKALCQNPLPYENTDREKSELVSQFRANVFNAIPDFEVLRQLKK
ncbi:hypothetical protein OAB00_01355 [Akkermansiaceae bacterium]|nr:hypothetical protein [Akkermansiaceae bacterium]